MFTDRANGKVRFADDVHFNKERHPSNKKHRQHHPYSASKIKHFQEPKSTDLSRRHSVHVGRMQVSEDVKRMGLPSILEKRDRLIQNTGSSTSGSEIPSYMQLTKAASRRRKNHRRFVFSHSFNTVFLRELIWERVAPFHISVTQLIDWSEL